MAAVNLGINGAIASRRIGSVGVVCNCRFSGACRTIDAWLDAAPFCRLQSSSIPLICNSSRLSSPVSGVAYPLIVTHREFVAEIHQDGVRMAPRFDLTDI